MFLQSDKISKQQMGRPTTPPLVVNNSIFEEESELGSEVNRARKHPFDLVDIINNLDEAHCIKVSKYVDDR